MGNKSYLKGCRLERAIVNKAREAGLEAARSAGSHSKVDCFIIDKKNKKVYFLQCKAGKALSQVPKHIQKEFEALTGKYMVKFKYINSIKELGVLLQDAQSFNEHERIERNISAV